jgi:hypothetical protein
MSKYIEIEKKKTTSFEGGYKNAMNLTQWGETVTESRVPNYTSSHFITTFSQPHSFFLPSQPFSLSIFHSQISIHTFNCNNQLAATTMSLSDSETSYGSGGGSEYKPFRHISRDSEIPFLPLFASLFSFVLRLFPLFLEQQFTL